MELLQKIYSKIWSIWTINVLLVLYVICCAVVVHFN